MLEQQRFELQTTKVCLGLLIFKFLKTDACTVFDPWLGVRGYRRSAACRSAPFYTGTCASADLGIHGGPGTSPHTGTEGQLKFQESKVICGFSTEQRVNALPPHCSKFSILCTQSGVSLVSCQSNYGCL